MDKETIDRDNNIEVSADIKQEEQSKDSFEILIRGTEILRINTKTKEIVTFQCINQCLRGKKEDGLYFDNFIVMEHNFSVTVKNRNQNDYILNVFGDTKFELEVEKNYGTINEKSVIFPVYEECLDEYIASYVMQGEDLKIKVWITIIS